MADNQLITSDLVAKEALANLVNNLSLTTWLKQPFNYMFGAQKEYVPGETISYKYSPRYKLRTGNSIVAEPQATIERQGYLTLGMAGIDISFNGTEFTLKDVNVQRKIATASEILAQSIETSAFAAAASNCNMVYAVDKLPTSADQAVPFFAMPQARLTELAAPISERAAFTSPIINASMVTGFSGLFNPSSTLGKQFKDGTVVGGLGLTTNVTQMLGSVNIVHFDPIPYTSFALSSDKTAATLTIGASSRLAVGDSIFLSSAANEMVCWVNPVNYNQSSAPYEFKITAVSSASPWTVTVAVPDMDPTSLYRVIDRPPATGLIVSPVPVSGTYEQSFIMHRNAMVMASVPFRATAPNAGGVGVDVAYKRLNGVSMTVSSQWDYKYAATNYRIDVLYGFSTPYPSMITRLLAKRS